MWQMIIIAISLSIDALGIGVAYNLKGIKIGIFPKILIGLVSICIMYISILLGYLMNKILPYDICKVVGASILILIGVAFIRNSLFESSDKSYDFNHSKNIDWYEALILGVALSADTLSAGTAIYALGISSKIIPILTGIMQTGFLYIGEKIAKKSNLLNNKICGIFSGILLIIIAIVRCY